jgi:hypothetical protein
MHNEFISGFLHQKKKKEILQTKRQWVKIFKGLEENVSARNFICPPKTREKLS